MTRGGAGPLDAAASFQVLGSAVDDAIEKRSQRCEVEVLGAGPAGGVVLGAADAAPVQLPSGVLGELGQEHALGAAVAFAERVQVVELVVVVGEALDEGLALEPGKEPVGLELVVDVLGGPFDSGDGEERLSVGSGLAYVDGAELAGSVVDALERVSVDLSEFVEGPGGCGDWCLVQLNQSRKHEVALGLVEGDLCGGTDLVPEQSGGRVEVGVGVDEVSRGHSGAGLGQRARRW